MLDYQYNTGSYNYSKNAEYKNAENLLIIKSQSLANMYKENFQKRLSASMTLSSYETMKNNRFSNSENRNGSHRKRKVKNFSANGWF